MRVVPFILAAAVIGLAGCASPPEGHGPWCASANTGGNHIERDCSFRSLAECRTMILGGNRGFCDRNPRWHPERKRRH